MSKIAFLHWADRAPLPQPRAGCAAGVVDGRFVLAGGTYWRDDQKCWSDRVDAFNPGANRWERLPPLPRPSGDVASVALDDTLYVFGGGAAGPTETVAWKLREGAWTEVTAMTLPAPRRYAMAASLDGTIFLLGGIAGSATDFASALPTVWSAKPGDRWEGRASMPGPVRFGCVVGGIAGRLIVAGGCTPENGAVRNLDEILAYNPATDTWSIIGRLPAPSRGAAALVEGGRLLAFGGYTDTFETCILAINAQGEVSRIGELPVGLAGARFVAIGSEIVGASGENGIKMRFPGTIACAAARQ